MLDIGGLVDGAVDAIGGTISDAAEDFLGPGIGQVVGDGVTGLLDSAVDAFGLGAPNVDDKALAGAAQGWTGMADRVSDVLDLGSHAGQQVVDNNASTAIDRFASSFSGRPTSPLPGGDAIVAGLDAVAGGLFGAAGAGLAAKVMAMIQGVQLAAKIAQAVAAAPATMGQSLTLIPGFREIAAGNVQGAIAQVAQFLDQGSSGPAHGLFGQLLQGTGLVDRLGGPAATPGDATTLPVPAAAPPTGGGQNVDALVQSYLDRHIPYAWGGGHGAEPGPTRGISDNGGPADAHGDYNKVGLDCSGLARDFIWQLKGIDIGPGATGTTIDLGTPISPDELQPGDLIYPHPGHVQVYIGNGQVLEAPQSGEYVQVSPYNGGGELRRYE